MPPLLLPNRTQNRRMPTPSARVDWMNPLTRKLGFLAYPSGGAVIDRISGSHGVPVDATVGGYYTIPTGQAIGNVTTSGNGGFRFDNAGIGRFGDGPFTLAYYGAVGANTYNVLLNFSGGSSDAVSLSVISPATSLRINVGSFGPVFDNTVDDKIPHLYILTAIPGGACNLYIDGKLSSTGDSNVVYHGIASDLNTVYISGTLSWSGGYALANMAAAWDRVLSAAEIQSLWRDPWQLVQDRRRYVVVAGGASSQSTTPTATTVTLAAVTPSTSVGSVTRTPTPVTVTMAAVLLALAQAVLQLPLPRLLQRSARPRQLLLQPSQRRQHLLLLRWLRWPPARP